MKIFSVSLILSLLLLLPVVSYSEVVFYDKIALVNGTIMLKAETRGRFFSKGGEIVEFAVNKKSIGKSLSGGDGNAFREFTPRTAGIYKISVTSGKHKDSGLLLSLIKGTPIVFIDEAVILDPFSAKTPEGSTKTISEIAKRFQIVYVKTGVLDLKTVKKQLEDNKFVTAPVIFWNNGDIFRDIKSKGLNIKFIIGTGPFIESAREFNPAAFSFEDTEGATEVKDWEDLGKKVKFMIK